MLTLEYDESVFLTILEFSLGLIIVLVEHAAHKLHHFLSSGYLNSFPKPCNAQHLNLRRG